MAIYYVSWALFIWIVYRNRRMFHFSIDRWVILGGGLILVWVIVAMLSLPDIQIGQALYLNTISFDHQTRIALTDAIFRTGIPPVNPHIYPGGPLYISYFYFWNLFPALLSRFTKGWIDPRISFQASAIWAGIALRALAFVYIRLRSRASSQSIKIKSGIAAGLFLVTGLDVIFAWLSIIKGIYNPFITEAWNGNSQVTSWAGATLWVPHHVAGLIAGITGILLFMNAVREASKTKRIIQMILAGLSLASLAGLSIYLAIVFAVFWGIYLVVSAVIKETQYQFKWLVLFGGLSVLFCAPFLIDLLHARESFVEGGGFLLLEIRSFGFLQRYFVGLPAILVNLINLFLLPVNYFLELGFFILAGVLYLQKGFEEKRFSFQENGVEFVLLITSVLICSFFRSGIIDNNDIGWRGFMPAQFILLIWSVDTIHPIWARFSRPENSLHSTQISGIVRGALSGLLVIGLFSTFADLTSLRLYQMAADRLGKYPIPSFSEHRYADRSAYQFIRENYPLTYIVQSNPIYEATIQTLGLYGMRQTVAAGEHYSFIYGDSPSLYQQVSPPILRLFTDSTLSVVDVKRICSQTHIDVLVVKDIDPVWKSSGSWVASLDPDYENEFDKVFDCRRKITQ
ncbi:MAG TPA: hypothetical protein VHO48_13560 [Anaerolineaceae bacterium]|nr:hypothetical protein [Anaerolineaceae bacterium]